MNTHKLLTMF